MLCDLFKYDIIYYSKLSLHKKQHLMQFLSEYCVCINIEETLCGTFHMFVFNCSIYTIFCNCQCLHWSLRYAYHALFVLWVLILHWCEGCCLETSNPFSVILWSIAYILAAGHCCIWYCNNNYLMSVWWYCDYLLCVHFG